MSGGTVDLDNSEVFALAANKTFVNAPLTIDAATMADYGSMKTFGMFISFSELIVDNLGVETGTLTVNLDDPNAEWTVVDDVGIVNLVNDNTPATLLAGSDVNLEGTLNVTGDVRIDARLDIEGTVNITTAGEPLRLSGGNGDTDPNTIAGGTINGPGILGADSLSALQGFGTINANIDFDGSASLHAAGGTLNVNGAILDAGQVGSESDGILNVANPWNTSTVAVVVLFGGELRGATITNDLASGIKGTGLLSARVINNSRINGEQLGTLVVETAGNDNDWDGTTGTGLIFALSGDLELRDNAAFPFTGTVIASFNQTVFANGFALQFVPGSTLELRDGSRYRSTNDTSIDGIVTVGAGTATLEIDFFAVFESGSSTALTGDLHLDSGATIVEAGATFGGGGNLVNLNGSQLRLNDGANVGVLIENQGLLSIASVGRADVSDVQQTTTGRYFVDLAGTGLSDFDQLVVSGAAQLDGTLGVFISNPFIPPLGATFTILSAAGDVTGSFDQYIFESFGVGTSLDVIYGPTSVILQVVAGTWGDYNQDGVVDTADYIVWRKMFGQTVTPFSGADGDGDGMVDSDDYHVWTAHFGQIILPGSGAAAQSLHAAVPEPRSLVLILAGASVFLRRLRHIGLSRD